MKKIILLLVLSITITSAYSGNSKKMGIMNLKYTDSRETVLSKLNKQYCESVTSEQLSNGREYLITAKKIKFTFKKGFLNHPTLSGNIIVKYNKNHISEINFIADKKNVNKYIDFLNEKYFPNIDSDIRWWSRNLTILKSKNYIFTYRYLK